MGVFDLTGRAQCAGDPEVHAASVRGWRKRWPRAGAAVMIGDLLEEQGRRTAASIAAESGGRTVRAA
jgi:hypothetical protein